VFEISGDVGCEYFYFGIISNDILCPRQVALPIFQLMSQLLFDRGNGFTRIQMLGADLGTVHNSMTTVQLEGIIELGQSFFGFGVSGILNPSIGLHEHSRAEVLVGTPPVTWTGSGAASTENALVHAIEFGPIFNALQMFPAIRWGRIRLKPWFNGAVLFVEIGHVRHKILDHVHVRQGVNLGGLGEVVLVNEVKTSQSVGSINVHGTRSTNAFAAGTAKGQCRILFVFDFQESVQDHGATLIQIDRVGAQIRRLAVFGVIAVHFKVLDSLFSGCGRSSSTRLE
jgi:hypothetical protein